MHRLILLRHGKAESVAASGGDFERGLTERGRRDAKLIGQVLADAGLAPDLALVSAARRAQETWSEAAAAFPAARPDTSRLLYLASVDQLSRIADGVADTVAALMIVGHNPGLHDFALAMMDQGRAAAADIALMGAFPTASAAVFHIDESGKARFDRFFQPRQFGGGAV